MVNDPQTLFVRRHRGPSGYHDEVFHDDDISCGPSPSCSTTRPAPTASWTRLTVCRMPSSTTAPGSTSSTVTWPGAGMARQHPQVHGHPVCLAWRVGRTAHANHPGGGVPTGLRAGPVVDRLRWPPGRRQDDVAVVHGASNVWRRGGPAVRRRWPRYWPEARPCRPAISTTDVADARVRLVGAPARRRAVEVQSRVRGHHSSARRVGSHEPTRWSHSTITRSARPRLPTWTWFCACSASVNTRAVIDRAWVRVAIWSPSSDRGRG